MLTLTCLFLFLFYLFLFQTFLKPQERCLHHPGGFLLYFMYSIAMRTKSGTGCFLTYSTSLAGDTRNRNIWHPIHQHTKSWYSLKWLRLIIVKSGCKNVVQGGSEDVEMGRCLQNVGVKAVHARDDTGVCKISLRLGVKAVHVSMLPTGYTQIS